ncbi:MAG: hypothetical protein JNJ77_03750 [Planctomycetia bacterium]|nr:hypothetical protein [Planctomycetia bacterium]
MQLFSWLRSTRPHYVPDGTRSAKPAEHARLGVEPLEDRTVPSTFRVLNLADSGPGSLRAAIADANIHPGADLVRFDAAARNGNIILTSGQLSITDDLQIDGPGAGRLAVSGNNASRVFQVSSNAVVSIEDLTISHGGAVAQGGGIFNAGTLTLSRVTLSDNQVTGVPGVGPVVDAFGGGIFNTGNLTVRDSRFVHNQSIGGNGNAINTGTSALGGAIMSNGTANLPATATVSHSVFIDNQAVGGNAGAGASRAGIGGAISNGTGTVNITDSLFQNNQAVGGIDNGIPGGFGAGAGGAVGNVARFGNSILTINRSTFLGNRAVGGASGIGGNAQTGRGGAIANYIFGGLPSPVTVQAIATVTASTFLGNEAIGGAGIIGGIGQGGGIANLNGGILTVSSSLIALNRAVGGVGNGGNGGNGQGGGIFNGGISPVGTPSLSLEHSLVVLNRAEGGVALGGGSDGLGQGGGLYLAPGGLASADLLTLIFANDAATSDEDVYGNLV